MNCLHSFHFLIRWLWVAFFLSAPSQFARATFTEDRLSPEACIFTQQQNANTAALTNAAGAIVERVAYSPYGGIRYRQSNYDTPFLYGGFFGVLTDSNGLIAMRARYYHPGLMRFLTGDPARDGLNWYAYAGGNPLAFADPSGFVPANVLDAVHLGLTVLGFVPGGIGTVANLVNAGISLARDDPGAALGHLAAAVPGLGGILAESRAVINTVRSAAQIEQVFVRAEAAVVRTVGATETLALPTIRQAAGGLVIGRGADLSRPFALAENELRLSWPATSTVQTEWKINSGLLRQEIGKGLPIRDASPGNVGGMFLNAERNLLESRGWTYNNATGYWHPPTR